MRRGQDGPAFVALALSGAAGLAYEVVWIRRAGLVFGSTVHATSTVLAVFFAGLALGSWVFGRWGRALERPLATFARLELGVALLALASLFGFDAVEPLFGSAYRATGGAGPGLALARVGLVAALILPASFLMGGTLPVACRALARGPGVGRTVGVLYAVNTLGGAAGAGFAGLVLLPSIGLVATVVVGCAANVAAAAVVSRADRGAPTPVEPGQADTAESPTARERAIVGALFALIGFVALGQEVLWTRFLSLFLAVTVHTYTLVLVVTLVGIVLGSLMASGLADRLSGRARLFGVLQIVSGLVVSGLFVASPDAWQGLGSGLAPLFVLLLPPAVLSGASFPLAVRMVTADPARAAAGVGRMAALNTAGGIAGSLLLGFVVLPNWGLEVGARVTTGLAVATGVAALLLLDRSTSPARRGATCAVAAAAWVAIPFASPTRVPRDYLATGGELVDHREGLEANLAVLRREGSLHLEIDRAWQGQDRKNHQIVAAHLPMLLHPAPRRVAVVGIGVGQTAERFLLYDVERLVCVDVEPTLFDFIREHFDGEWMDDERVTLVPADGRNHLAHTGDVFDVVSLELGQVFRPGVAAFYTRDAYESVAARLAPGGIACQFVPIPFLRTEEFRSVVATFLEVFPVASLWYNTSELLLVGSREGELAIDFDSLVARLAAPAVAGDLAYSPWGGESHWLNDPASFLGSFLVGPAALAGLAEGGSILGDDRPSFEYATAVRAGRPADETEILARIADALEPVGDYTAAALSPEVAARAFAMRGRNLGDLAAEAPLRRVDEAKARRDWGAIFDLATEAIAHNPENARAHRVRADALLLLDRVSDAKQGFERALAIRQRDGLARRGLAFVLHREGDAGAAIPHYRVALEADPRDAEAHNGLGAALAQTGSIADALPHFEEALRIRPDYDEARRNAQQARAALE